jgi:hypothetical protein
MPSTQIGTILSDFLALYSGVFTTGGYINISELTPDINYYASIVFAEANVSRVVTNNTKFTYNFDLIVYINNVTANDLNNRIEFVMDNILTIANYDENPNFRAFCGNYQLINAGIPVAIRTGQGLLLDKNQEMVVTSFGFYKN